MRRRFRQLSPSPRSYLATQDSTSRWRRYSLVRRTDCDCLVYEEKIEGWRPTRAPAAGASRPRIRCREYRPRSSPSPWRGAASRDPCAGHRRRRSHPLATRSACAQLHGPPDSWLDLCRAVTPGSRPRARVAQVTDHWRCAATCERAAGRCPIVLHLRPHPLRPLRRSDRLQPRDYPRSPDRPRRRGKG
jgi:hypothetical protein